MTEFKNTAVLGAGVIGASWTALFLASGRDVAVHDITPNMEKSIRDYVERAWPSLEEIGLVKDGSPDRMRFNKTAAEAVEGASFVQENVPERLAIKHALYGEIEAHLAADAVVATSASGLTLSEMQRGWGNPSRFVLGHPFNPPHLIPLVEIMGNDQTAGGVVEDAERFYAAIGKVTIRVNREIPRPCCESFAGRRLARSDPSRQDRCRIRRRRGQGYVVRSWTSLGRHGPDNAFPPRGG